ncbi:MAG: O-antigen ligase family protein [Nostoc sp.]|uniref:O-antigen ligase family protein n=1 Tax=Nostoc sp. TaxID=1180 RepID=UPI002FFB874F
MNNIFEMKSKNFTIQNIAWFLLLVVGLSFNWTVLRNRSISLIWLNINLGDMLLLFVIFISIATRKWGMGSSYLSRFLVILTIGTFVLGAVVCIFNINGNIDMLIRSSRGFMAILIVCAYTKNFNQNKFNISLLSTLLICPTALIFYSFDRLGIISYGNFEFTATATGFKDDFANTIVSGDGIQKFFFIEFVSAYFCLAICFFMFAVCKKNIYFKLLAALGIFSCYGIMATNLSRTFIILSLIFSVVMIFNVYTYNNAKSFQLFFIIILGMITSLILFWITQGSLGFAIIGEWFQGLYDPNYAKYGSPEVRLSYIGSAIEAFSDSPLFGHGIGADFTYYLVKFGNLENPYNFGNVFSVRIAQTGLIGVFLWISFNFILVKHIYFRTAKNSRETLLKNTLFLVHIFIVISGLTYTDSTPTLSQGLIYGCIILMADYINKYPLPEL